MATAYEPRAGEGISFGRIFNRAFGAIRGDAGTILGLAFVFGALPGAILSPLMTTYTRSSVTQNPDGFGFSASTSSTMAPTAANLFVSLILMLVYTVALGAIVRATVAHADARRLAFGEAAAGGLRVALPLIGLSILLGLAVGVASIFLLVPGIILAVMWAVAIPARAVEPIGVFGAFGRSRHLTKGTRWTIFGFGVVVVVVYLVVVSLLGLLAFAGLGVNGMARMAQDQSFRLGPTIVSTIISTIIVAIAGALHASLYVELRNWKDGPQAERLADIFA